jgi:hypothetical protein
MLALRRQFQSYEGFGKIFIDVQHEIIELTLYERLWGIFLELQMSILKAWNVDLEKLISDVILDDTVLQFLLLILEKQSEQIKSSTNNKAA